MTPEERAKRQDAMNSALRNALDNVALVRPNANVTGLAPAQETTK